jgi:LysR family transcriptional regulator, carnitine catabolism transcriptional activator
MKITLKQIEIFLSVAETLSFSQAAVRCHLSQPALSANIQRLEDAVGARLFDRHTRKVSLTPVGADLREIAIALSDNLEHSFNRIQDLVSGRHGRLVIAAAPSLAASLVPRALATFRADHPGVGVQLHDALSDVCIEMVRARRADLALGPRTDGAEDLLQREIFRDPLVVVHPADHPLGRKRSIKWADVNSSDHILMSGNSSVRQLVQAEYNRHGVQLQPMFEVQHVGTMLGLIASGLGIGVLPRSLVQTLRLEGLAYRRFNAAGGYRSICSITLRGFTPSPTAAAFIRHFSRHCSAHG